MNKPETDDTAIKHHILNEVQLESGVINKEMLENLIMEQGYEGEAGRLARLDPINYNNITTIRLQYQDILKVDHLWVLPNLESLSLSFNKLDKIEGIQMLTKLKELDLSFNHIEKIENLDQLTGLEVLTLFNNNIKKLENLDSLEQLSILSVGNNKIDTYDGIERLRFMKKLRSLNLDGNPISQANKSFRLYISAFLPSVRFYNYISISDKEREKGLQMYSVELRQLEEAQLEEVKKREKVAKEIDDEKRLSSSFVEQINDHQFFDSLFVGDTNGRLLLSIGEEVEEIFGQYRKDFYILTQQIYKLGLEKHEARLAEISVFKECVNEAKRKSQQEGIEIVDEFMCKQELMFDQARAIIAQMKKEIEIMQEDQSEYRRCSDRLQTVSDNFNSMVHKVWQTLLENELSLFERLEEANAEFAHVIMDMINEFIEDVQALFVQIRDTELAYSESILETVSRYIIDKQAASDEGEVPEELRPFLEDKEAISNLVAGSRDFHMQKIDLREDKLMTRGRKWVVDLVDKLESDEIERNRKKILEIDFFLEKQRETFNELQDVEYEPV